MESDTVTTTDSGSFQDNGNREESGVIANELSLSPATSTCLPIRGSKTRCHRNMRKQDRKLNHVIKTGRVNCRTSN